MASQALHAIREKVKTHTWSTTVLTVDKWWRGEVSANILLRCFKNLIALIFQRFFTDIITQVINHPVILNLTEHRGLRSAGFFIIQRKESYLWFCFQECSKRHLRISYSA